MNITHPRRTLHPSALLAHQRLDASSFDSGYPPPPTVSTRPNRIPPSPATSLRSLPSDHLLLQMHPFVLSSSPNIKRTLQHLPVLRHNILRSLASSPANTNLVIRHPWKTWQNVSRLETSETIRSSSPANTRLLSLVGDKRRYSRPLVLYMIWPQSATTTGELVLPLLDPTDSIAFTTCMPFVTLPNTTCLPSSHEVATVHRKNCSRDTRHETREGVGGQEREGFHQYPRTARLLIAVQAAHNRLGPERFLDRS